jgi:hypothetical protein
MQVVKELTPELIKAEGKDRFYTIEGVIKRMLAPQDPKLVRPYTYSKDGWGKVTRVESNEDGAPTALRAKRRSTKVRTGESEVKAGPCWAFNVVDGNIMLPWENQFGIFKKSLQRSLEAQNKMKYDTPRLSLMRVYPQWLNVGKAPADSQMPGNSPFVVLETRHTQKGDVMVEVFFDYVVDRPFKTVVEVDSECPLNEEKLVALFKSLNTLDTVGPAKRGHLQINKIDQIKQPSDDELAEYLNAPAQASTQ